jgi:hypothetical protein
VSRWRSAIQLEFTRTIAGDSVVLAGGALATLTIL